MANAVLVIDMVRGFLEPGHALYCGDDARKTIPATRRLLERELQLGATVFFVCDTHDTDDLEFQMFPPHCIQGTAEAEVVPELAGYPGTVIRKRRYSAFFETDLALRLKHMRPEKLLVCGVCTDICVMHTVADARNRDYQVEVYADCVASFDEKAHRFALEHMEKVLGARVLTSLPAGAR